MTRSRYYWVILPYASIIFGMLLLRSAWGALIGFHISLLPVLVPIWRTLPQRFSIHVSKYILLLAAIIGLTAGIGLWLIWPYTGLVTGFSLKVAGLGLSGWIWAPFILYFSMVNPWLEEAYWRTALSSSSPYPALVDFLFAGYHLIILSMFVGIAWMAFGFTILVLASWFWRQISRYTDSLLPAVFSHMLADLSLLVVICNFAI